ncbi:MAG: tetratricopeptide repeat protein [Longimicrobiales bacterium]
MAGRRITTQRRVLVAVTLLVCVALQGCATKKDVRSLQATIADMQMHQDTVLRNIQRQNRLMLDTLRSSMALTLDSRGQSSFRFQELNTLIEQTKQLMSQNLESMRQLATRMDALEARMQPGQVQAPPPQTSSASGMTATQAYQAGLAKMKDGSYGSARQYFQNVIRSFRNEPEAPLAQFQIGESWVMEDSWEEAYTAFDQVATDWPSSPRASEALCRAGKVAEDRKDNTTAKRFYSKVVQLYATSDCATLARAALRRIPR